MARNGISYGECTILMMQVFVIGCASMYMYENTVFFNTQSNIANPLPFICTSRIMTNDKLLVIFNAIISNQTDIRLNSTYMKSEYTVRNLVEEVGQERLLAAIVKQQPFLFNGLVNDHIKCESDRRKVFDYLENKDISVQKILNPVQKELPTILDLLIAIILAFLGATLTLFIIGQIH